MDLSNEYVVLVSGWVLMILSELIAASKLESNSVTELIINILKLIAKK